MDKSHIISEIKRTAQENGGVPLGTSRFAQITGIQISDWNGKYWARWGDALVEAGFKPNILQGAFTDEHIIIKLISLIRELGKYPVVAELKMKSYKDKTFPTRNVFWRLGGQSAVAKKVIDYCKTQDGYDDVIAICEPIANTTKQKIAPTTKVRITGYVYLIKHGTRHEYKIGKTNNPIRREGEIGIELPERVRPVHYIGTDDPSGIESYWHNRFSSKRKNGEWFELSNDDVLSFKRRKYM